MLAFKINRYLQVFNFYKMESNLMKIPQSQNLPKTRKELKTSQSVAKASKQAKKRVKVPEIPSHIELVALGSGYHGTAMCLVVSMPHFK